MVLVDTSIWIDYFRGIICEKIDLSDSLFDNERIVPGDLVIAELMQGFRTKSQLQAAYQVIMELEYFDLVGKNITFKAAENYRYLLSNGITVRKTVDIIIGTFCIENDIRLLHNDKDFIPLAEYCGLVVV
ncbi:MAG TPA: PIN domain-containing protein [Chitinispirillaceae bacterium]|nr:PIN domain-containing protein [Chitinispirillaceae bacterium]